jgi:hypothetical protein
MVHICSETYRKTSCSDRRKHVEILHGRNVTVSDLRHDTVNNAINMTCKITASTT